MAKPKGHKRGCGCIICSRSPRRKTAAKKKTARKRNPTSATSAKGKLGKWIRAKSIRVRKVAGQILVDVRR